MRRQPREAQRRLNHDESQQVVALYLSGVSMNEVARISSVHRSAVVVTCLRRAGVEARPRNMPTNLAAKAAALYEAGWSLVKIEDKLGYGETAILTALKHHGVATRPRNGWNYF